MKNLADLLQIVENQLRNKLPFALYIKPDSDVATAMLQSSDDLFLMSDFDRGFIMAPFEGDAVILPCDRSETISAHFTTDVCNDFTLEIPEVTNGRAFEHLVASAVEAIRNTEFTKVVLSRKETISTTSFSFTAVFRKMASLYPTAFRYCFYHPKAGFWMGASPEKLLEIQGKDFSTVALAGTKKYSDKEAFFWPAKEKDEQKIVSDYIVKNLQNASAELNVSEPYTFQAGSLLHIKTDIAGRIMEGKSVRHLLELLHPTPAVCGFPKASSKGFILKNEGYDRQFYSGYLGEYDNTLMYDSSNVLFVNLRCMQITDNAVHLYIGCGITIDSNPEKEYIETVNKSMTMKKILN